MARITKKLLIGIITNILQQHPEKEICIVKYQDKLKNGRWGLHAYVLRYVYDELYVSPWSGAAPIWRARLEKLKIAELQDIVDRCMYATK